MNICMQWQKQQKIVPMQTKIKYYINKDETGL